MLPVACLVRLAVDFSHPAQWGPYAFVMMGFPRIFIIAEPSSHWRRGSTVRCVWPALLQACRDAKGRGSLKFSGVAGAGDGYQRQLCGNNLSVFIPSAHPPPLQRNKCLLSLLVSRILRIAFLLNLQARTVKVAGLGAQQPRGVGGG